MNLWLNICACARGQVLLVPGANNALPLGHMNSLEFLGGVINYPTVAVDMSDGLCRVCRRAGAGTGGAVPLALPRLDMLRLAARGVQLA